MLYPLSYGSKAVTVRDRSG